MNRRAIVRVVVVMLVASLLTTGLALAAGNKSTITIQKKSKNKGEIVFGFTPDGGELQEIPVNIVAKMSPQDIAKDVQKELSFKLPEAEYVVSHDGAKVIVKTVNKKASFSLILSKQSVEGVSIAIK